MKATVRETNTYGEYYCVGLILIPGGGGGYIKNFMTGVCGPNLEDTPSLFISRPSQTTIPIHIKVSIKTHPIGIIYITKMGSSK